jgi:formylglycine-generating enzyme required for sulfatase activity
MAGNLWEWVEDDYHGSYDGAPADGAAWTESPRGSDRVIRGGSWGIDPRYARVADRFRNTPGSRFGNVGFRLARSLPSSL